jgi:hypothetical protein
MLFEPLYASIAAIEATCEKKQYQPKLMSPRVLHTLNFEECQFFTRIQKHHRKNITKFHAPGMPT